MCKPPELELVRASKGIWLTNFHKCIIDPTVKTLRPSQNSKPVQGHNLHICAACALLAELPGHAGRYADISLEGQ